MAVSLKKGQKVDLTKTNPGLKEILIGLGWDTNKYDGGKDFDLDAAAFLLNGGGKVNSDADFIFYGNLKHASESVEHMGDNLTGAGEGDDEEIKIDLSKVPADIEKIDFTVTIMKPTSANKTSAKSRTLLFASSTWRTTKNSFAMTWAKIFPLRPRLSSASFIAIKASGNSTQSAPASAADSVRCVPILVSTCKLQ